MAEQEPIVLYLDVPAETKPETLADVEPGVLHFEHDGRRVLMRDYAHRVLVIDPEGDLQCSAMPSKSWLVGACIGPLRIKLRDKPAGPQAPKLDGETRKLLEDARAWAMGVVSCGDISASAKSRIIARIDAALKGDSNG